MNELPGYSSAISEAVYRLIPESGYLRAQGDDRIAFFQRQTTNDINRLAPQGVLTTILTSPAARILDVLCLLDEGETLGVITLPYHGAATMRYLKSRIFFMDKVSLSDLSPETLQIDLEGPKALERIQQLGFDRAPGLEEVIVTQLDGGILRAVGQRGLTGISCRFMLPAQSMHFFEQKLDGIGIEKLPEATYAVLRVEAGLPSPGAELTDEYTPLETGLDWAIADNKGCYTGQEVIARQITFDKVTQHLVGLRLKAPALPGERISVEGKPAGVVTSAVHSPRFGEIALAIMKRPYDQPGTTVQVSGTDQPTPSAIVSKIPFID